jgi:DnaJ-class molecular chaperone
MRDDECDHGTEGAARDPRVCSVCVAADADDDEPYNDSKDHTKCPDCKGTGRYIGLGVDEPCKRCDGAGWI